MRAHIGVFSLRNVYRIDLPMVVVTGALVSLGLMVLLSATYSGTVSDDGHSFVRFIKLFGNDYVVKQLAALFLGVILAGLMVCVDYRFLVSLAPLFYLLAIALLVAVLAIGEIVKGGQRWISLGPVNFQPSEFAKLALIYMLAWYFTLVGPRIRQLPFFLLTFLIPAIPAVLILKQPNLGTTLTLGPIVIAMLFAAGCKRWHLGALVLMGLTAAPVAWTQLEDYQKERVMAFVNPSPEDLRDSGYHTLQTMITVGSGQMHGKGFLKGTQTHLSFLPEHHTDFIFAVLAEEKGFVGAIVALGLLAMFFLRGLALARDCPDITGTVLAVGVVTILAFHVFVNVAICIGIMPVTGIPLPFFSYGPSFYLITMMAIGTLLSVRTHKGYFH